MSRMGILMLVVLVCFVSTAWPQAQIKPEIITFDAPGAGTSAFQGTIPLGNDAAGTIMGFSIVLSNAYHGFLPPPDGRITTLDAPGAGIGAGQGTQAFGLNREGAI